MAIRQEQVVLIGTGLLLSYMLMTGSSTTRRGGGGSGSAPDFDHHYVPDVQRALPSERLAEGLSRDLFSAPRDTRPLPELEFVVPPMQPLELLRPAPNSGPAASLLGTFLRQEVQSMEDPGLFLDEAGDGFQDMAEDEYAVEDDVDDDLLTAEERQQRTARYKTAYDSINIGSVHYGQIRNADRYSLSLRVEDAIDFIEVDPASGKDKWPGQAPIVYERSRIDSFAFADTVENRLELERLTFKGELSHGKYLAALDYADNCFAERFNSARALEMAIEAFTKCASLTSENPRAELGLASCAEAAFDFERAFEILDRLIQGQYSKHPVTLTRMAQLETRFRMIERARRHFEMAESYGRTSWYVQWHYGSFLLAQGENESAVAHLKLASQFEPTSAEFQDVRGSIRTDYGNALVAVGDLEAARGLYKNALMVNPDEQRARAGLLNIGYLTGKQDDSVSPQGPSGAGFELLVAKGLIAIESGEVVAAKDFLTLAAEADPLRAYEAWRALSYLAEITGNLSEALAYIDQAEINNPADVYSLYQRGRILALSDDNSGALESLSKALDLELDLPDALSAIGLLEMEAGNHEDAERYFERAIGIDRNLRSAITMRGLNALSLGRPQIAAEQFDNALSLENGDPVASIGRAWCTYALGDPTEAKTLLREFEDSRREMGAEDAYRAYALEQIDRIGTWQEKVVWTDRFERQDLRNGWKVDEVPDTLINMREGNVAMEGSFDQAGRTRLKRFFTSGDFVSLEAKLTIQPGNTSRVGLFVALEQKRGSRRATETTAEVTLSRHPQDKKVQYRSMRKGRSDEDDYVDSEIMEWKDGQTVTLRLERYGESAKTAFRVLVDGVPIIDRLPMPAIGSTTREIVVGVFAEGEPGRTVSLLIDDVQIIRREL
ncbi:MAG: tetratricopeptide (TPR) repeat protein [Planctomycetota bacterium]